MGFCFCDINFISHSRIHLVKVLSLLNISLKGRYSICVAAKEIAFFVRLVCGAHFLLRKKERKVLK